jgi:hypothetical protein
MKASTGVTLVVISVLVIGGTFFLEHRAEAKAKAFCSRFTIGGDFNQAIEAVSESGVPHGVYERSNEKTVYVQYMGVPPFSVHICFIDGVGGKIIRLRPEHYQAD